MVHIYYSYSANLLGFFNTRPRRLVRTGDGTGAKVILRVDLTVADRLRVDLDDGALLRVDVFVVDRFREDLDDGARLGVNDSAVS